MEYRVPMVVRLEANVAKKTAALEPLLYACALVGRLPFREFERPLELLAQTIFPDAQRYGPSRLPPEGPN
jgi:hypothetical protein